MKTHEHPAVVGTIVVFAVTILMARVSGAVPSTRPATRDQITHDLTLDAVHLANSIPDNLDVGNEAARAKTGTVVIPIVHHALRLIDQLPPNCKGESMSSMKINWEPLLIVFGDTDFNAKESAEAGKPGDAALHAKFCLSLADLTLAGNDAAKAEEAAKRILDGARSEPKSDDAAFSLMHLQDDERLSADTRLSATTLLAQSQSGVGSALRFAAQMATTRPAP